MGGASGGGGAAAPLFPRPCLPSCPSHPHVIARCRKDIPCFTPLCPWLCPHTAKILVPPMAVSLPRCRRLGKQYNRLCHVHNVLPYARQLTSSFRRRGGGVSSCEAARRCCQLLALKFTSRQKETKRTTAAAALSTARLTTSLYLLLNCGGGNGYNVTRSVDHCIPALPGGVRHVIQ